MKTLCGIIAGLLLSGPARAQVPFAQPAQAPLLLNPSVAGNKQAHRISLALNHLSEGTRKDQQLYLSYDGFLRNVGAGVYYLGRKSLIKEYPDNYKQAPAVPGTDFSAKETGHEAGLVIAPKFNVMHKLNPNKIRFSLAPSVYLAFSSGKRNSAGNFSFSASDICTCLNPEGSFRYDSADFTRSRITKRQFTAGLGLMLTTDNILLFVRLQHETTINREAFELNRYYYSTGHSEVTLTPFRDMLYAVRSVAGGGISLPKRQDAALYFTPFVAAGLRYNLNTASGGDTDGYIIRETFRDRERLNADYRHFSLNIRYRYFLAGLAYTRMQPGLNYYGISAGFQNRSSKTILTFGSAREYFLAELTTGVWF